MANKYRKTWMKVSILLLIHLLTSTIADFTIECQTPCLCRWQSGNKAAICSYLSLINVPDNLSKQVQILDLSNNPLQQLHQEAFKNVGLNNLKKLYLRECNLKSLDKNAFASLSIMIELDLSKNLIHHLYPDTFKETEKLRLINLSNNYLEKLEDETFKNLQFLQKVELRNNIIFRIGVKAFVNLPQLKIIRLDGNRLDHMKLETLNALRSLSGLDLHNNPWRCDCNLQSFRDWVVRRNLYTPPTSCAEPASIRDKFWNELHSSNFACRPTILESLSSSIMKNYNDNVTLSCKVMGTPSPAVSWRFNGKILQKSSIEEIRYFMTENTVDTFKWVNLTIMHARYYDRGNYTCIAENDGGREEKTIVLILAKSHRSSTIGGTDIDCFAILVGCFTALIIMFGVILAVYFITSQTFCMRRLIETKNSRLSNETAFMEGSIASQPEKEIHNKGNALNKLPRKYNKKLFNVSKANGMLKITKNLLESEYISELFGEHDNQHQERNKSEIRKEMLDRWSQKSVTYPPDLLTFPH